MILKKPHLFNKYLYRLVNRGWLKNPPYTTFISKYGGSPVRTITNAYVQSFLHTPSALRSRRVQQYSHLVNFDYSNLRGVGSYRFRYLGKSYRVIHQQPIMFLKFNKAHRTTLLTNNYNIFMFRRLWFRIRTTKPYGTRSALIKTLKTLRPRNLFTKRGLWYTKSFT